MKAVKLSDYIKLIKPVYTYARLIPKYSVENNTTHNIARAVASLHKNILAAIKVEQAKLITVLGKQFMAGTQYSVTQNPKVSYYIHLEKRRVEFYFIIPEQYFGFIKEKLLDSWPGITIEGVEALPEFSEKATKYHLAYVKEPGLSLAVDKRTNALLESNLTVIDVMDEGDKVGIFYNFMPASQHSWQNDHNATLTKFRRGTPVDRNKLGPSYLVRWAFSIIHSTANDLGKLIGGYKALNRMETFDPQTVEQLIYSFRNPNEPSDVSIRKGRDVVLNTQIITLSESPDPLRQRNNARSLAQSFDRIAGDNTLRHKHFGGKVDPMAFSIRGAEINKLSADECSNLIALPGRGLLERYPFINKIQTQESMVPDELTKGVMLIGETTCQGVKQSAYLSDDFDYRMLSLVTIGPNRAGKTKLLANLAKDAIANGECVIIPDFIGTCQLSTEIASVFPESQTLEVVCDDWDKLQGMGYNEVPPSTNPFVQYKNAKEQTALLMTLVDSINADDANFTARMGRYFESAALVVFLTGGSIKDVFAILMNHKTRKEFINRVPEEQLENMMEYLDYLSELDDVEKGKVIGTRQHLITGAVDRLQRLKVNAYLEMMLKKGIEGNINLVDEFQKNQLIVVKMPQRMFLTDNEKDVYVTYWLTKIWLALQVREAKYQSDRTKMLKVNLIIDELYQVSHAEKFLKEKLSQLPKFNIKPIISCHYLNQLRVIREEFRCANASYMLISGCDKANFNELRSELYPFTEEDLLALPRFHSLNMIKCDNGYAKFITKLPKPISC